MPLTEGYLGLGQQLAKRLFPLVLGIACLISLSLPGTYYVLASAALRRTANTYAQHLAERVQSLNFETSVLWKSQTHRYTQMLQELLPHKAVITVRILDQDGHTVTRYTPAGS